MTQCSDTASMDVNMSDHCGSCEHLATADGPSTQAERVKGYLRDQALSFLCRLSRIAVSTEANTQDGKSSSNESKTTAGTPKK
ncbi:hypothetical protein AK830_g11404 [Neonectria ditissima]|uniref:Uncharacterized protein n=1 Tax=Neonectria ditissima TaxID=78410 RepID=A0A0P7B861_9HYPO|nr:hypothetical protein AK830_g11404 [Neonectria ditissima]